MAAGVAFYVLMLLWLVFGLWWGLRPQGDRIFAGGSVLLFLLFLLLGWAVFGAPVK